MVADLIQQKTGAWNNDLIDQFFLPFEASQIKSISINFRLPNDPITWHYTKNGIFLIRSAYHMSKEQPDRRETSSSRSQATVQRNRVWALRVSSKVKHFLWRLLKSILLTCCIVKHRGMDLDMLCPICLTKTKTINYLLMHCEWAKRLWSAGSLGIRTLVVNDNLILDWFVAIEEHFDAEILEL